MEWRFGAELEDTLEFDVEDTSSRAELAQGSEGSSVAVKQAVSVLGLERWERRKA